LEGAVKVKRSQVILFSLVALSLLVIIYGGYFQSQSFLASTNLPIGLRLSTGKVMQGVTIAGLGVSSGGPSLCAGAVEYKQARTGMVLGASCYEADLSWDGDTVHVRSGDNVLLGGFLNISVGSMGIQPYSSRDSPRGWDINFELNDVLNFYKMKFVASPKRLKLNTNFAIAIVNYVSLLKMQSFGGVTVKDKTSILRTLTGYRFVDERIIHPGDNLFDILPKDDTLGDLTTSVQPHFYIVQSTVTLSNNPNRASTSSGSSAVSALQAERRQRALGCESTACWQLKTFGIAGMPADYVDPSTFYDKFTQNKLSVPVETTTPAGYKTLGDYYRSPDFKVKLARIAAENKVQAATYKTNVVNTVGLHLLDSINKYNELFPNKANLYSDLQVKIIMAQDAVDSSLKLNTYKYGQIGTPTADQKSLDLLAEAKTNLANAISKGDAISPDTLSQQRAELFNTISVDASIIREAPRTPEAQKFMDAYFKWSSQSFFSLFSSQVLVPVGNPQATSSVSQEKLPEIGTESGADFLIQGANNVVYKGLFLEGDQFSYFVGANLDYAKYALVDNQFTPYNQRIILKDANVESTDNVEIFAATPKDVAQGTQNAISAALSVLSPTASGEGINMNMADQASYKIYFLIAMIGLLAFFVFGGRRS